LSAVVTTQGLLADAHKQINLVRPSLEESRYVDAHRGKVGAGVMTHLNNSTRLKQHLAATRPAG
jgi:hypothetical protein